MALFQELQNSIGTLAKEMKANRASNNKRMMTMESAILRLGDLKSAPETPVKPKAAPAPLFSPPPKKTVVTSVPTNADASAKNSAKTTVENTLPAFIVKARESHPKSSSKEQRSIGKSIELLKLKKNDMSVLSSWLRQADLRRSILRTSDEGPKWDYVRIQQLENDCGGDPWRTWIASYTQPSDGTNS